MELTKPFERTCDLVAALGAIRERTLGLVEDLDGERMSANGDAVYNSAVLAHDDRWDAPLLSVVETKALLDRVLARVSDSSGDDDVRSDTDRYFLALALLHECMHAEALTCTRQTLGYGAPRFAEARVSTTARDIAGEPLGDASVPAGQFLLGSAPDDGFVFDNEQWAREGEASAGLVREIDGSASVATAGR